jgi:hypothetical protein
LTAFCSSLVSQATESVKVEARRKFTPSKPGAGPEVHSPSEPDRFS